MIKKLLLGFMLLMLFPNYCNAGPISTVGFPEIVTSDDVTMNWLNNFRNTTVDTLNSFPGDNIQTGTIVAGAMSDNANPEIRWGEAFTNFVYTGLLPATTAGTLISTTTAGTAYIKNDTTKKMVRVVKDATANTYTATMDTYVDLSLTGVYTYSEKVIGGNPPSVAANSIRLCKVTTDGTKIAAVEDKRILGIQLATTEDFTIKGMELYYSNPSQVSVDDGVVYVGATRINKVVATVLVLATNSDWYDGTTHSYAGSAGWCYIGADASGNIKLLGNNPPDKHDTTGTTIGKLYYWYDTVRKIYWRVTSSAWVHTDNTFTKGWFQDGRLVMFDVPNQITTTSSATWAVLNCSAAIPSISTLGVFGLYHYNNTTSGGLWIRPNGSTWNTLPENGAYQRTETGTVLAAATTQRICFTNSSQQIQYIDTNTGLMAISVEGYYLNIRD